MLTLSLVTPGKKILTDVGITDAFIPTAGGEVNILVGHAPLMAVLDIGILRYCLAGETQYKLVVISWGYLEVSKDRITVLAETAEPAETIDLARAEEAKKKAEKALVGGDLEQHQFRKHQLKLERAMIRLQAAEKQTYETTH